MNTLIEGYIHKYKVLIVWLFPVLMEKCLVSKQPNKLIIVFGALFITRMFISGAYSTNKQCGFCFCTTASEFPLCVFIAEYRCRYS